jgi:hypothetical protein
MEIACPTPAPRAAPNIALVVADLSQDRRLELRGHNSSRGEFPLLQPGLRRGRRPAPPRTRCGPDSAARHWRPSPRRRWHTVHGDETLGSSARSSAGHLPRRRHTDRRHAATRRASQVLGCGETESADSGADVAFRLRRASSGRHLGAGVSRPGRRARRDRHPGSRGAGDPGLGAASRASASRGQQVGDGGEPSAQASGLDTVVGGVLAEPQRPRAVGEERYAEVGIMRTSPLDSASSRVGYSA